MGETNSAVERLFRTGTSQPRADAQRNARRLVNAAREALTKTGISATSHDIARRAGVGIGTFYRRVPSREALLEAVLIDTVDEILTHAAAATQDPDPWRGFREFATEYVQLRATSCGINDILGAAARPNLGPQLSRLRNLIRELVSRAQSAGAMRDDVTWQDVAFALSSVIPDSHTIGLETDESQWRRTLDILLQGLRPVEGPR